MAGTAFDEALEARVRGVTGIVSVALADLSGRWRALRDSDAPHDAASTMKLPVAVAAFRLHERGELDLDAEVPVVSRFPSLVGGHFALSQGGDQDDETWARLGGRASLRRLVEHSIVWSGNLATDVLLLHVPPAEVQAVLREAGCSSATSLPTAIGDVPARRAGVRNVVSAADLARVMAALAAGRLASPATCAEVEAVLSRQRHRDMVAAALPQGVYVASKSGWVSGVCHDVALVRPSDSPAYVLAVCTTTSLDGAEGRKLVASISDAVWRTR